MLGGIGGNITNFSEDFNSLTTAIPLTLFTFTSSAQNTPTTSPALVRISNAYQNGRVLQELFLLDGSATYYRVKQANAWSSWQRIDNFGCTTAADLATLLGVNVEKTEAQVQAVSTTSLEALRSMGNIRALFSTSGTITPGYYSDLPQRNFGIFSQVIIGNNCIQEYYVPDSGIIYRRYWNNGSSTMLPWKKIVLASV